MVQRLKNFADVILGWSLSEWKAKPHALPPMSALSLDWRELEGFQQCFEGLHDCIRFFVRVKRLTNLAVVTKENYKLWQPSASAGIIRALTVERFFGRLIPSGTLFHPSQNLTSSRDTETQNIPSRAKRGLMVYGVRILCFDGGNLCTGSTNHGQTFSK